MTRGRKSKLTPQQREAIRQDALRGDKKLDDVARAHGVTIDVVKNEKKIAAKPEKRGGLEAAVLAATSAGPLPGQAGAQAPGQAPAPAPYIPTRQEVVAYCQALLTGVGGMCCAATGVAPDANTMELFVLTEEDRNALALPAEAAAPDLAELLKSVKYAGLISLGVAFAGIAFPRLVIFRQVAKAVSDAKRATPIRTAPENVKTEPAPGTPVNGEMKYAEAGVGEPGGGGPRIS